MTLLKEVTETGKAKQHYRTPNPTKDQRVESYEYVKHAELHARDGNNQQGLSGGLLGVDLLTGVGGGSRGGGGGGGGGLGFCCFFGVRQKKAREYS